MSEDVTDHELPARAGRSLYDALRAGHRLGQRLFDEYMRAGFHRFDGELRMRVRQRVDRDDVGTRLGERLLLVRMAPGAGEGVRKLPVADVPRTDTDDLEIRDARVGERVRQAHIAETDHQHAFLWHHQRSSSVS